VVAILFNFVPFVSPNDMRWIAAYFKDFLEFLNSSLALSVELMDLLEALDNSVFTAWVYWICSGSIRPRVSLSCMPMFVILWSPYFL
jgi:hypothetical protein